jgi:dihydrofolate synthase / folylpolyglutamate synthase
MTYQKSLNRLINLESAPKLGLERMYTLMALLDHPEESYQILHVAGTNGKGSVCAFLESILEKADISRGRYTSPHLQCARERILINGALINEQEFCEVENLVNEMCLKLSESTTFFERMTAMALLSFQRAGVKVAILEVGLGGRLDATNIVQPSVCGITRIDIDHAHILGDTLAKIAAEKAGIIKTGVPVVSNVQKPEAAQVIKTYAERMAAPLCQIGSDIQIDFSDGKMRVFYQSKLILPKCNPALLGSHQVHNASVAVAMIELSGLVPDLNVRRLGVESAKWPGRYETVNENPLVILDGAHNPAGMQALLETIKNDKRLTNLPIILVVGMTDGHDVKAMASIWQAAFSQLEEIIVTQANIPRALPAEKIMQTFLNFPLEKEDVRVFSFVKSRDAIEKAMSYAKDKNGFVMVAGSLYLVGEVRGMFCEMPRDEESPHY